MNPYLIHTFDHQWQRILERNRQNLNTLHIVEKDGFYRCLDLNITCNTLSYLKIAIQEHLDKLNLEEPFPHAPIEEWREIWGKTMVWRRILPNVIHPISKIPIAAVLIKL